MSFACYLSLVQQVNESQGFFAVHNCTYPFLSVCGVCTVCAALHFRPPISSGPKTKSPSHLIQNCCNQLHQIRVKWIIIIIRRCRLCALARVCSLFAYVIRCQRRNLTKTKKKKNENNVAVRSRCSRRRKYVTYANSYVALCTITGCSLLLMQSQRNTQCAIFNALWIPFFFLSFGLLLFSLFIYLLWFRWP